jgi:hypothetical protein
MTPKRRSTFGWALVAATFAILPMAAFSQSPVTRAPQVARRNTTRSLGFQKSTIVFATAPETAALLTARDPYRLQLSPLDRRIIAGPNRPTTDAAIDQALRRAAREFTAVEKKEITLALQEIEETLAQQGYRLPIPAKVIIAKQDAQLYSGNPYTRANAIFLNDKFIAQVILLRKYAQKYMARVLLHEFWHVASRAYPERRTALYKMIGFTPCNIALSSLGADVRDRIITNPDVEDFGKFCIDLPDGSETKRYTSLLIAGKSIDSNSLNQALTPVLVEVQGESAVVNGGKTKLRKHDWIYYVAIGGNGVGQAWQPEEIIAKNLETAFVGEASSDSPDLKLARRIAAQAYRP